MALRQRQRLRALRNDPNLARFVVEGVTTGNQLGTGSYGAVEEVSQNAWQLLGHTWSGDLYTKIKPREVGRS